MRRRLIGGFFLFTLAVVLLLEVPLGFSLSHNARTIALSELQNDSASLGVLVGASLGRGEMAVAMKIIARFARAENAIVVVVSNGKLEMSAGAGAAEEMAEPPTRAILRSAEAGRESGEEGSRDPDDDLLYAALPVAPASPATPGAATHPAVGAFTTVLLVAEPAAPLHRHIASEWIRLAIFGAVILAVATAAGTMFARSLTRHLGGIEASVAAFGAGSLSERAPVNRGPSELRALADTINEMAERLEELLHAQRAFVADASHQLRTPMTALRLRLENLEDTLDSTQRTELAPAIAEADRLSRVVDGLLALARTDGTRPTREEIDVSAALRERADAWSALAEERHVTLSCKAMAAAGSVSALRALACAGHIEQVLDNLLANALDATPAGGSVQLGASRIGGQVEIHVIDSGPGMTSSDRTRAFDRFWRPEGAHHEGSGLGLAIVAQLVRVSGGTAWLDVSESGGVDAIVRLEAC